MKAATKRKQVATTRTPVPVPTLTLYYFEFCAGNLGIWSRNWFSTRQEAQAARQERAESLGTDLADAEANEDQCGEYGDISEVHEEQVRLNAQGVLGFANNFAVDNDCG